MRQARRDVDDTSGAHLFPVTAERDLALAFDEVQQYVGGGGVFLQLMPGREAEPKHACTRRLDQRCLRHAALRDRDRGGYVVIESVGIHVAFRVPRDAARRICYNGAMQLARVALVLLSAGVRLWSFQAGGGPYPIGNGVSAPAVLQRVEPQMPQEAKDAGVDGEVILTTVIDASGIPTQIVVTKGLGHGLDEAAASAVSQWRFKPGMKDGVAVSVKATIAVKFKIVSH